VQARSVLPEELAWCPRRETSEALLDGVFDIAPERHGVGMAGPEEA
jgi:hypothetical protein